MEDYLEQLATCAEFIATKINDERVNPLDFYNQLVYNINEDVINVELESVLEQLRGPLTPKQHLKLLVFTSLRALGRQLSKKALEFGINEGWREASLATEAQRKGVLADLEGN